MIHYFVLFDISALSVNYSTTIDPEVFQIASLHVELEDNRRKRSFLFASAEYPVAYIQQTSGCWKADGVGDVWR